MSKFTVNGQPIQYSLDPDTPLLWALRDASNLTGTKYGCGTGDCGVCTVDIDDKAIRSCQTPIKSIEGAFVTTIEGLSNNRSHPVQKAWLAENVTQCGFCDPGMIMAASVLLKHVKAPSDTDIDTAINNICRCGSTVRVRRAVQRAAAIMAGSEGIIAVPPPKTGIEDSEPAAPSPAPNADVKK